MPETTEKKLINSVRDLDNFIGAWEAKLNTTATRTTTQAPTPSPATQQATLDKMIAEIRKATGTKMDILNSPPLFKKPAFFLDKLTPFLEVDLVFIYDTSDNPREPYQEYRVKLFSGTGEFTSANHLLSFKYTIGAEQNSGVIELRFIDVKNEILDYMLLQFQNLSVHGPAEVGMDEKQPIHLEIEYGWAHNKDFTPTGIEDWDKICFTNKITSIVKEVKPQFNQFGVPEVTIIGNAAEVDNFTFKGAKPWDILGNLPAFSLVMKEVLVIFEEVFNKMNKNKNQAKVCFQFLQWYLEIKGVKNIEDRITILKAACKYFKYDIVDHVTSYKDSNRGNVIKNVNRLPELVDVDNKNTITYQPSYHVEFRTLLESETTTDKKPFTEFFAVLGTHVHNNFRVHPYILYKYSLNLIVNLLNSNHKQKTDYTALYDFYVHPTNILPTNDRSGKKGFMDPEYLPDFSKKEDKIFYPYYCDVKDFRLQLTHTWDTYFKGVFEKMYAKYVVSSDPKKPTGLVKLDVKKEDRARGFVPLRMNSHIQVADFESAKKNLKIYLDALQARQKYMNEIDKKETRQTTDKNVFAVESIQDCQMKLGILTEGKMYLLHFIALSGNPQDLFNTMIGKQMIAQTYSMRVNGLAGSQQQFFNPGEPYAVEGNFLDIVSLNFDFDYMVSLNSIATASRIVSGHRRGRSIIESRNAAAIKKLLNDANTVVTKQSQATQPGLKQLKDIKVDIQALNPYSQISGQVSAVDSTMPINISVDEYQNSRVYGGDTYNALEKKRTIQNIRNNVILQSRQVNATLTVLGDPTFNYPNNIGLRIYLKVINMDNSLSMFTGIYMIKGVTHEISAGKFMTTFNLQIDSSSNESSETKKQLRKMIYEADRQKARFDL